MDQWFKDLLGIVSSQKKTNKMDLLLPELYSEFDILARKHDVTELMNIYRFIKNDNPIKTNDESFNKLTFLIIKKELMLRSILLGDLSIIDEEMEDLVILDNKVRIKEFINLWSDNQYIYRYLKDKTFVEKPLKKEPPRDEPPRDEPKRVIKKEPEVIQNTPKKVFNEEPDIIIEPYKEDNKKTPEKTIKESPKKVESKPIRKPKAKVVKKEIKKQPIKIPEPFIKKAPIKEKNVVEQNPELDSFFELIDKLNDSYNINLNIEKLKTQTNPRRAVYTAVKEYVDQYNTPADGLLEMVTLFNDSNEYELIGYLANKSQVFLKVCSLNIGLLSEKDINSKKKLIDFVQDEVSEYISLSICEISLREFIDYQDLHDSVIDDLIKHSTKSSIQAPSIAKAFDVKDCIDFFEKFVHPKKTRVIDTNNIAHVYWSMVLAAYLSIYTIREYESNYTKCINMIEEMALKMINLIDDDSTILVIKTLATSYIRKAYKSATKSENYETWWERQKDDLMDAKLEAIMNLSE